MNQKARSVFDARLLILPALAVAALSLSGCFFLPWPLQTHTTSSSTVGNSLELRDTARDIDLAIRVKAIKLKNEPGIPPQQGPPRWLGVHLVVKNMSSATYRDTNFQSCASLVRTMKPALDMTIWGAMSSSDPWPHSLPQSVTIKPGAALDGWLWFAVQGKSKKYSEGAPDFRRVHIFWFCPAGGESSVRGAWDLKP